MQIFDNDFDFCDKTVFCGHYDSSQNFALKTHD